MCYVQFCCGQVGGERAGGRHLPVAGGADRPRDRRLAAPHGGGGNRFVYSKSYSIVQNLKYTELNIFITELQKTARKKEDVLNVVFTPKKKSIKNTKKCLLQGSFERIGDFFIILLDKAGP